MKYKKYSLSLRIIHWVVAILIFVSLFLGLTMEGFSGELKNKAYFIHKSLGVTIFLLFFVRLASRLKTSKPPYNIKLTKLESIVSNITHTLLYILMLLIPISGYLMTNALGYGVSWFGINLPLVISKNEEVADFFYEIHEYASFFLIGLIILHLFAVLKHRIKDKNFIKRIS